MLLKSSSYSLGSYNYPTRYNDPGITYPLACFGNVVFFQLALVHVAFIVLVQSDNVHIINLTKCHCTHYVQRQGL